MDPARGIVQMLTELGETAFQQGIRLAAGLGAGLEGLDPTDLPTRVAGMADGVVEQGRANTDLIVSLVRSEVDKAVGRVGFVREEELAALRRHVERLEAALIAAGVSTGAAATRAAAKPAATKPAAAKPAATKPAAKKTAATKPAAKKTAATKTAAKKPAATKTAAKKSAAKKNVDGGGA